MLKLSRVPLERVCGLVNCSCVACSGYTYRPPSYGNNHETTKQNIDTTGAQAYHLVVLLKSMAFGVAFGGALGLVFDAALP